MTNEEYMRLFGGGSRGGSPFNYDMSPVQGGEFEQGNALAAMYKGGTVSTIPSTYEKDAHDLDAMFQGALSGGDLDKAQRLAVTPQQKALLDVAWGQAINEREQRGRQAAGQPAMPQGNLVGDYRKQQENEIKTSSMRGLAEQDRRMKIAEFESRQAASAASTEYNVNRNKGMVNPTARGPKGQIVDGQWVSFDDTGSPTASAIPGLQPKEKPSTEDEKKAAGWGIRMENALRTMDSLGKANPEAVKPQIDATLAGGIPFVGGMAENKLNSSPRRQIEATQLDALDAALTLATGAAYTKEQLKNLSKSYFPQIGDEPADIAAKQKLLKNVIQTARIRAGNSAGNIDKVLGPPGETAPEPTPYRLPNAKAVSQAKNNPALRAEFIKTFGPEAAAQYGIQ